MTDPFQILTSLKFSKAEKFLFFTWNNIIFCLFFFETREVKENNSHKIRKSSMFRRVWVWGIDKWRPLWLELWQGRSFGGSETLGFNSIQSKRSWIFRNGVGQILIKIQKEMNFNKITNDLLRLFVLGKRVFKHFLTYLEKKSHFSTDKIPPLGLRSLENFARTHQNLQKSCSSFSISSLLGLKDPNNFISKKINIFQ